MNEWARRSVEIGREIAARPGLDPEEKAGLKAWVKVVEFAGDGRRVILPKPAEEKAIQPDLCAATYELLSRLREPSVEERDALKGYLFFRVSAESLAQVMEAKGDYLGYVDPSEKLRSYVPPGDFVMAVNPNMLRLPGSNNSSQAEQLIMTEEYSKGSVEPLVPHAKAIMLPTTALVQMDVACQEEHNGEKFFPDFLVRALDETVGPDAASVGRDHPGHRLRVNGWDARHGGPGVWACPAVVFVRQ